MNHLIEFLLNLPQPTVFESHIIPYLQSNNWVISEGILNNLHSVIYVALFYHLCFLIGVWFIFPPLATWKINWDKAHDIVSASDKKTSSNTPYRKHHKSDTKRHKDLVIQGSIHFISLLQTLVVLYLSISFLINPRLSSDPYPDCESRIFGYHRHTEVVCIFAIGYFMWDAFISLLYSSLPFVLHGIVSSVVYFIGIKPYIQYYAPVFLIFEISNPFLNIRWFGLKFLPTDNKYCNLALLGNNLILLITFFIGRIAWGWYQIGKLCYDFYQMRNDPRFVLTDTLIIVGGNFVLDILNVIWFSTMLTVAIKVIKGKK